MRGWSVLFLFLRDCRKADAAPLSNPAAIMIKIAPPPKPAENPSSLLVNDKIIVHQLFPPILKEWPTTLSPITIVAKKEMPAIISAIKEPIKNVKINLAAEIFDNF